MSYLLTATAVPWEWVLLGGMLGGVLNAITSSNLRLFPAWLTDGRSGGRRMACVGLLASSAVGAATAAGLIWLLLGRTAFDGSPSVAIALRFIAGSIVVGFVTARGLTNEVDKMLLRRAVRNAASAPAAHPEIAKAIEHAPAYAVYKIAVDLLPRRHVPGPGRLHVSPDFHKAQPQRS